MALQYTNGVAVHLIIFFENVKKIWQFCHKRVSFIRSGRKQPRIIYYLELLCMASSQKREQDELLYYFKAKPFKIDECGQHFNQIFANGYELHGTKIKYH